MQVTSEQFIAVPWRFTNNFQGVTNKATSHYSIPCLVVAPPPPCPLHPQVTSEQFIAVPWRFINASQGGSYVLTLGGASGRVVYSLKVGHAQYLVCCAIQQSLRRVLARDAGVGTQGGGLRPDFFGGGRRGYVLTLGGASGRVVYSLKVRLYGSFRKDCVTHISCVTATLQTLKNMPLQGAPMLALGALLLLGVGNSGVGWGGTYVFTLGGASGRVVCSLKVRHRTFQSQPPMQCVRAGGSIRGCDGQGRGGGGHSGRSQRSPGVHVQLHDGAYGTCGG